MPQRIQETVAIAAGIDNAGRDIYEQAGLRTVGIPKEDATPDRIGDFLASEDANILAVAGSGPRVPADVFETNPDLYQVSINGKGTDHVDLEAAQDAGVVVTNSPYGNSRSVAELTVGGILDLSRHISRNDRSMRGNGYPNGPKGNHLIEGKRVGLWGMGAVPRFLAPKLVALGMEVYGYDPFATEAPEGVKLVDSPEELAETSQFLSIHVPSTPDTVGRVNAEFIARMERGSKILNTSRADVLVDEDVVAAMASKYLGGVFIDVHPKDIEDASKRGEKFQSPYLALDPDLNVIVSPHNGASTVEDKSGTAAEQALKALAVREGTVTDNHTMFPTTFRKLAPGITAVLLYHENVPDTLRPVHDAIGSMGLNEVSTPIEHKSDPAKIGEPALARIELTDAEGRPLEQRDQAKILEAANSSARIIRARTVTIDESLILS